MKEQDLLYYATAFQQLSRDRSKGGAPHKPILLLSLIDVFENEAATSPQMAITPEIIAFFKANWVQFVTSEHHLRFALPFYHMKTEPFWNLIPNPGCEMWLKPNVSISSLGTLQLAVKYAEIDINLANILKNKENRDSLRQILLEKYFPTKTYSNNINEGLSIIQNIKNQIVEEHRAVYFAKINALKTDLDRDSFEEEVVLRSSIFKREIPKNYGYTCSISKLSISTVFNNTALIEACHIEPFSLAYNDMLTNGIALTPTLHRAFDRGIVTISDDYKVIVSKKYTENDSPQGIKQYHGSPILLPLLERHYPNLESLFFHRTSVFER